MGENDRLRISMPTRMINVLFTILMLVLRNKNRSD